MHFVSASGIMAVRNGGKNLEIPSDLVLKQDLTEYFLPLWYM